MSLITLRSSALLLLLGMGTVNCGSEAPTYAPRHGAPAPTCVDDDGDGFGESCAPGPDCDDSDPEVWDDCPGSSSSSGGGGEGGQAPAECEDGATKACKVILGEHNGVKSCFEGTETCYAGAWGPCTE